MFLKAGALSLALLLVSRLLGLARESSQAAAFGTSGLADVVVLMLTLPDWLTGVLASGALAYVLVPAWAGQPPAQVAAMQRRVVLRLVAGGVALALLLLVLRRPAIGWLAGGLPSAMLSVAADAIVWSALALPAALLAALWTTRLQHERDFTGMYAANVVVNGVLVAAIACTALRAPPEDAWWWLGLGLLAAMLLRLVWLRWRTPRPDGAPAIHKALGPALPGPALWLWAAASAGLPLALPFAARSIVSQSGEGALATFNYAWKLVELPLLLAIQLVATLALPMIARALSGTDPDAARGAVRSAFALTWALACAAAAALLLGAPAIADLLFGWGRMDKESLALVAQWGALGAWGLPPQGLIAVAVAVLAARRQMKAVALAYAVALALLLAHAAAGVSDGSRLMMSINILNFGVAAVLLGVLGGQARAWLPWRPMAVSLACLLTLGVLASQAPVATWGLWTGLTVAALAGLLVMGVTWWGSSDLRAALTP